MQYSGKFQILWQKWSLHFQLNQLSKYFPTILSELKCFYASLGPTGKIKSSLKVSYLKSELGSAAFVNCMFFVPSYKMWRLMYCKLVKNHVLASFRTLCSLIAQDNVSFDAVLMVIICNDSQSCVQQLLASSVSLTALSA